MNIDLYKNIYLIGVGGIGMSALARYFKAKGKNVFGYDKLRSNLCVKLESEGISIHYKDMVSAIPEVIKNYEYNDSLIIYTSAISDDNKILSFFTDRRINIFKRAEILGVISSQSFTIAVAGTHGKTTTSTILAHILQESGKSATAFLGGISRNYNTNLLFSKKGNILIVEADEYDRSFLHINADVAIITSVDADHLDIYKNKNELELAFTQFASQVKEKGLLLVEKSVALDFSIPEGGTKLFYSSKTKADYFADNIRMQNGKMIFDMIALDIMPSMAFEKTEKNIELELPGLHNVSNAVAAYAAAFYLGLSCKDIAQALTTFKGISRRFDRHIDTEKLVYIDDYAHHPEEVSATIDTTKKLYPLRQLIVVFQPHLYSRTQDFVNEFAISLQGADDLVLLDIYPSREKPIPGVNSKKLLDLCNNPKKELCSKEDLLSALKSKHIDVLLTLGAGDISTLVQPIKHMLN